MKKILLITFLVLFIPNYAFAAGACLVESKTAEALSSYIKDNRTVVKNVTKAIVDSNKNKSNKSEGFIEGNYNKAKQDFTRAKNETISTFNEIFNFTGFYSYFRYFAVFPISNEVPYQVKRDYKILDNESKGLVEYIKRMDTNLSTNIIVKNACNGVEKNCDLDGMTAKEIIGKLIQNNDKILNLFRLTVIGEVGDESDYEGELKLVDNNFYLEIVKNYGTDAISACNSAEGGFFEQISKAIQNIKLLNKQGEDGIQKWREAWELLIGKDPSNEALRERELLRGYLSEQGISVDKQNIMLDNLSKYNQGGLSLNNNFLTNTIASTFTKISNGLKDWKNRVIGDFFSNSVNKEIPITEIKTVTDNSKISIDIKENISKLYNDELPFAAAGDISTQDLRAKIIETHMSLDDSINILEKTCKISRQVCISQGGGGRCGDCN